MDTNDFSGGDHSQGDEGVAVRIDESAERSELGARIELLTEKNRDLREENERLRKGVVHTHRPRYRRLGLGLALLGTLSGLLTFVFPDVRSVLFAVAASGLFGGVLTYYLSHGDFLDATICDRIYAAAATNGRSLVEERNLRDERIYVPDGDGSARLFVPKEADPPLPDPQKRSVSTDPNHGVILSPTGEGLFREFERTGSGDLPDTPSRLTTQLAEAIVEQFELARSVEPTVDRADSDDRVVVAISDSALGDVDRFDHPITSFFAVGLAVGLERPVTLDVTPHADRSEWLATYQWEASDDSS